MSTERLHWSFYFIAVTAGIVAGGAVAGALAFVVFGAVTGAKFAVGELARNGAETLGFYAMMWAPGVALVLCVKRAYEGRREARRSRDGKGWIAGAKEECEQRRFGR